MKNKTQKYISLILIGYLSIFSYTQKDKSFLLIFSMAVFTLWAIILIKLQIDIYNGKVTRKAYPASLYPSIFFDEVFSTCEEKDYMLIETLQKEIEALQLNRTPENLNSNVCSISNSIRQIEQEYEKCLKNYSSKSENHCTITNIISRLKNKIELGHKAIAKEKEAFLSDNGENTVSFNFNRQNYLTDILLTGISIPILLETLKWEVSGIEDLVLALKERPIMFSIASIFLILLLYRILKYTKNKRSMLRSMTQTVLYDKAELMLCAFECALKNIDSEDNKGCQMK